MMKKILIGSLIMTLTLGMVRQSFATITYDETAETCAGGAGIMIKGVDNQKYCKSGTRMNWWSAFAWCEAAGGTLIPLERCNGKNGTLTGTSQCPNFDGKSTGNCWTTSVPNSSQVYLINSGAVNNTSNHRTNTTFALCE